MVGTETSLVFFVNGNKVQVDHPNPETSLLKYLRRDLLLPGTKEACGQGGCGSCTVMISRCTEDGLIHFSANACLVSICYLHGMAVTTVEGVGGTDKGLHPIQKSLVQAQGFQCGFCTPGMVMTMYTLFHNIPQPTADDMERALEGNLCRCTGYRPIVDGFKQASKECPCGLGLCLQQEGSKETDVNTCTPSSLTEKTKDPTQSFIFPSELQTNSSFRKSSAVFTFGNYKWCRPCSLSDMLLLKHQNQQAAVVMGCTSVTGYFLRTGQLQTKTIICGTNVPELTEVKVNDAEISIGSAVTMSNLELTLKNKINGLEEHQQRTMASLLDGLRWIGADQIRSLATIGGHLMTLAPNHDLQTLLMAAGAKLNFVWLDDNGKERGQCIEFDEQFLKNGLGRFGAREILSCITVPLTSQNQYITFNKQPGRRGFDYAILNAGMFLEFEQGSQVVKEARICYGNIEKKPVLLKSVGSMFVGKKWEDLDIQAITNELMAVLSILKDCENLKYKMTLAASFLYKFYLKICDSVKLPCNKPREVSAIEDVKLDTSSGTQIFDKPDDDGKHAVWQPLPNVGSDYIVSGEAVFIDDLPQLSNELFAATVTSTRAHAKILNVDATKALDMPGVVDYICYKDIPGTNFHGLIMKDKNVFAEDEVMFHGHLIGAVIARDRETARKASKLVNIEYQDLEAIFTLEEAIEKNSMFELPMGIDEGDMDKALEEATHVVEGVVESHGQDHFYFEPQTALAIPKVEQKEMDIYSSTQAIMEVQGELCNMLKLPRNRINVRTRRCGGGFGGKGTDSVWAAAIAALGAHKTKRPVRCIFDRATDMKSTGKRHPVKTFYKAAVNSDGKLLGLELNIYLNCGWCLDLSYFVLSCTLPFNASYKIPVARMKGHLCKTNTPSNTAMRGFGHPQKVLYMEKIMRSISHKTGISVNKIKEVNLAQEGDTILSRMKLDGIYMDQCWSQCKQQADFDTRLKEIEKFNSENSWKKRGIAMTPIVFNLGYPVSLLNQAYAFVNIYIDGTVLLTHGGIELGQGINTKMQQIAATVLGVPMSDILTGETSSNIIGNAAETGGSFVADTNGFAVKHACEALMERLKPFKEAIPNGTMKDWAAAAFANRVSLSEMGHYKLPGADTSYDFNKREGFYTWYFSHNAACSEVEIDCLTGEHQLLKTDIVMDIGKSLNPVIDVGQIEGGFIQGYGMYVYEAMYLTSQGQMKTNGPVNYKIPGVRNIPRKFNVTLLKDSKIEKSVYSSKGLGEPPLLLGVSVHEAIHEAVTAARKDHGIEGDFVLPCPATVDKIRMACSDQISLQCEKKMDGYRELNMIL